MQSEIVFHEGLRGSGVVASITYGRSRVIFDFGAPFTPLTQPFDGQLEPRAKAWVADAIRLGQIPPVDGVFRAADLGPLSQIRPYENSDWTAGIIISHLHLDHMSGIGMVHPDIPVYLHRDAHRLQLALAEIGEAVGTRSFSPIDLYEPFYIGEIRVTAYFSDHPCAGAVGYLIEPPDAKYYYSGDVRLHGGRLRQVLDDMDKLAQEQVDVLILEGTTLSHADLEAIGFEPLRPSLDIPNGMTSERSLFDGILADLSPAPGLGIFNLYHRDMELIRGLFDIAQQCQREIVFEPKSAYVVMRILDRYPAIIVPDNQQYEPPLAAYFEEVKRKAARVVTVGEIHAAPERFFIQNSYENILELFDWPTRLARYYHLYGVPLVEGGRDYENMLRVLRMTGTHYAAFADLYCYNHAYPNNLLLMADRIKAKNLVPVHTSCPEKLTSQYSRQVLPHKGVAYTLQDGLLAPSDPTL